MYTLSHEAASFVLEACPACRASFWQIQQVDLLQQTKKLSTIIEKLAVLIVVNAVIA